MTKLIALLMVLSASLMMGFGVSQARVATIQAQTQDDNVDVDVRSNGEEVGEDENDDTPAGAPETGFGTMSR